MKTAIIENKEKILGQFFTKQSIIEKLLDILLAYKSYDKNIKILEPSFGTGNFITVLNKRRFYNIAGCEIDNNLTDTPLDFFDYPTENKYDLIIGNPPFSKYNIKESYCYLPEYLAKSPYLSNYLPKELLKKEKEKIENLFILKSLKHLKDNQSSIAFILPISFFIKNKNRVIKKELSNNFSTVVVFQNKDVWFDYNIPCCFAIFTHTRKLENKIILCYENEKMHEEIFSISDIYEELIPEVSYNKKHNLINNGKGKSLKGYLSPEKVRYQRSVEKYDVSGKNILEKTMIPMAAKIENYKLAVVRVGNSSVGRCGLIDIKNDTLNDMFYVFDFEKKYGRNKKAKEKICAEINTNQNYFKNVTCRVGSKSIKKNDVFNFRVKV